MNFKTGDVVRVMDRTMWEPYRGRVGVVYPDLLESYKDEMDEPHLLVIFTPYHAERARLLAFMNNDEQHNAHNVGYTDGIQAFIEVDCLELVRSPNRKRRGKHHRMRTGGLLGEAVL